MDDVTFAHKPIARRRRPAEAQQCTSSLGLGYRLCAVIPVAGQRTHGTTFRVFELTSQVTTPGAESAVYDCLVVDGTSLRQLIIVFLLSSLSETAALRARKLPSPTLRSALGYEFVFNHSTNLFKSFVVCENVARR